MRTNKRRNGPALWLAVTVIVWAVLVFGVAVTSLTRTAEAHEDPVPPLVIVEEPLETGRVPGDDAVALLPAPAWLREDIPLEPEIQEALYAACTATGIRYELALAVVWKETGFCNLVGDGGESYGYMQVQPKWHAERMERLGVADLMDPASNFRVACDYLAELLERYDLPQALTAYNSGSPGQSDYALAVMRYMEELE